MEIVYGLMKQNDKTALPTLKKLAHYLVSVTG